MSKINNITSLRDYALDTLEQLNSGTIDTVQAALVCKLCDNVIQTVKTQMEYAKLLDEKPIIAFMGDTVKGNLIEGKSQKYLTRK